MDSSPPDDNQQTDDDQQTDDNQQTSNQTGKQKIELQNRTTRTLLTLPLELRVKILHLCLVREEPLNRLSCGHRHHADFYETCNDLFCPRYGHNVIVSQPAVLRACQQLRAEGFPMFKQKNHFRIDFNEWDDVEFNYSSFSPQLGWDFAYIDRFKGNIRNFEVLIRLRRDMDDQVRESIIERIVRQCVEFEERFCPQTLNILIYSRTGDEDEDAHQDSGQTEHTTDGAEETEDSDDGGEAERAEQIEQAEVLGVFSCLNAFQIFRCEKVKVCLDDREVQPAWKAVMESDEPVMNLWSMMQRFRTMSHCDTLFGWDSNWDQEMRQAIRDWDAVAFFKARSQVVARLREMREALEEQLLTDVVPPSNGTGARW